MISGQNVRLFILLNLFSYAEKQGADERHHLEFQAEKRIRHDRDGSHVTNETAPQS